MNQDITILNLYFCNKSYIEHKIQWESSFSFLFFFFITMPWSVNVTLYKCNSFYFILKGNAQSQIQIKWLIIFRSIKYNVMVWYVFSISYISVTEFWHLDINKVYNVQQKAMFVASLTGEWKQSTTRVWQDLFRMNKLNR